jgi:RimJ/RimL family protein N-acetyltransferase
VHRVALVPFSEDDAVDVLEGHRAPLWADGYPTEGDVEMAARIAGGTKRVVSDEFPWSVWMVTLADGGTVVGGAGFHAEPDDAATVEVGYGIAQEFRGRGIATGALLALLQIARENGAMTVVAGTDADNVPSQRVLQKSGFNRTEDADTELRWAVDLTTRAGS